MIAALLLPLPSGEGAAGRLVGCAAFLMALACLPAFACAATDGGPLPRDEAAAIANQIRECLAAPPIQPGADSDAARLRVATDAQGTIRIVQPLASGPPSSFTARAMRAAMDPRCAVLPLPPAMLGKPHSFDITLRR